MASIQKITEFKAGREALSDTHYTVYYDTGRRVNYYGRDTLPMTVVNFLTDENTVSETVYIEDNYLHCVNSRTTYTPADKPQEAPQEAPAAEAEQQPTENENAPQAATQAAQRTDEKKEAETMTTTEREALERINARQNAANLFTNIGPEEIAAELAAMEAEQAAPAADPDAATLAPADAAQVWTEDGETVATATEAATVAGIIRRQGGYRERIILLAPHTMTHGETWNAAHKVINVLESKPGPDGYRAGCAVDIVTRSIVG